MLKKVTNVLVLCCLLSMLAFLVHLHYSKNSALTYFTKQYYVAYQKDMISRVVKHMDWFWDLQNPRVSSAGVETTEGPTPTNRTLGPCPDTPPNLVGPLIVEFTAKRTWAEVRKEVGSPLQEGGRYKPPDCLSKHKVDE